MSWADRPQSSAFFSAVATRERRAIEKPPSPLTCREASHRRHPDPALRGDLRFAELPSPELADPIRLQRRRRRATERPAFSAGLWPSNYSFPPPNRKGQGGGRRSMFHSAGRHSNDWPGQIRVQHFTEAERQQLKRTPSRLPSCLAHGSVEIANGPKPRSNVAGSRIT
jgi:hypothetical protein